MCPLNSEGFITEYLISGLRETDFVDSSTDENQLRYEKYLRSIITNKQEKEPADCVRLGEEGPLGLPWRYYYNYGSWFVDLSTFYSVLTRVELDACTQVCAERAGRVRAVLWSYASVDLWCNHVHVCSMEPPVYKPIRRQELELELKEGVNLLYVRLQTLGVRDTRTLFGIQILDGREDLTVSLPDEEKTGPVMRAARWLDQIRIKDGTVQFPGPAPEKTRLGYDSMSPDYGKAATKLEFHDVAGETQEKLEAGRPYIVVECETGGQILRRQMEDIAMIRPKTLSGLSWEENKRAVFERTAQVESLSRGGKFGFSISNILARKYLGMESPRDRELFMETLSQIEQRFDCSDFLVCGLVRYLKNYPVDEELEKRVKEVLLGYRYWMDQEGSDAMCFWSENHSLMFYVSAMNVGEMYPEDYFPRAHMDGRELYQAGKKRVEQWLDDVETHGFEEFLSTVYMCVTFAGLLNAIDYTTEEISARASKVTDRLLTMLALHTFKGSVIAPMGRVYRQIIYPFLQGAQALMNLVNPEVPYSYGEGWLAFYATSAYKLPENLKNLMEQDASTAYETGNALICLEKKENYCLTSVQSPRTDQKFARWSNLTLVEETRKVDRTTHEYTKSLNERFHGTTCFEPGVYGYQQHMWSAALDPETHVFANHPGGSCDSSQMRPGYWFGNGVLPSVRQEEGMLGAIYVIPREHPIHFTHVFWPGVKFDQSVREGQWLFGRKGKGLIALWCSRPMEVHQDQLFDCEYRSYGDQIAYCCVCGDGTDGKTLEDFIIQCKELSPSYDESAGCLKAGKLTLQYEKREDKTQYI